MKGYEIDYLHDGYNVAFKLSFWNEQGKINSYTSPFMFETYEDAFDAAMIELSRK